MDILAVSLRYWCQYKLNTDPGWAKLKIIISDATVPGEGEHKIMDFVRSQRASPEYDPNTRHVIYGLDADLIMLGLATHEPHFRVLREDVFFQDGKFRSCKLCGQKGHDAQNCRGDAKAKEGEFDEKDKEVTLKPFIWLHVSVLREYLSAELAISDLPFRWDLERAIDDWIFMCCFVGNDFLPHLPALEIREHGIDTLTTLWRNNLPALGGYITKDGHIDLERAQCIMDGLAAQESSIFKRRKEQEDRREASFKRRKMQQQGGRHGRQDGQDQHHQRQEPERQSRDPNELPQETQDAVTHEMVVNRVAAHDATAANKSAASVLKERMRGGKPATPVEQQSSGGDTVSSPSLGKRKAPDSSEQTSREGTSTPSDGPTDPVRLWEDGYADRYYQLKFHRAPGDIEFRHEVANAYVEGLAWVLLYYFQGCPSWEWYYPFHYAPFAADFTNMTKANISFEKGTISRPFEQLMSVLPAASRNNLPEVFHDLMTNKDSEIIDFYPEDFEVDLNGKKMAWQGVALLPFIDMPRLLKAVQGKYPLLSEADAARNAVGRSILILSDKHESAYDDILTNFYSKKQGSSTFTLNPKATEGLSGIVEKQDGYVPHGELHYPLERKALPDLEYDRSITVNYNMPESDKTHKSMLLRGAKLPEPALTRSDIEVLRGRVKPWHNNNHGGGRGRFDSRRDDFRGNGRPPHQGGRGYNGGYNNGGYNNGGYNNGGGGGGYGGNGGYNNRGGYVGGNGNGNRNDFRPTPAWQPPAPGSAEFGRGAPPPLPPNGWQPGGLQHHQQPYQPPYHQQQGYQNRGPYDQRDPRYNNGGRGNRF